MRYTFKAYERLKREQHIHTLFQSGKAFSVFPIRVIHHILPLPADEQSPVRIGFSVPKKKFRLSVHRHRITRLLREAWRLNKHELYPLIPKDRQLHIFLIFTDKEMPEFEAVQKAVIKSIEKLKQVISSSSLGEAREEVSNA